MKPSRQQQAWALKQIRASGIAPRDAIITDAGLKSKKRPSEPIPNKITVQVLKVLMAMENI